MTVEEKKKLPLVIGLMTVVLIGVIAISLSVKDRGGKISLEGPEEIIPVNDLVEKDDVVKQNPRIIGTSVNGRNIESYTFGTGDTRLLLVGGIHGGYEWNSVLLAYKFIDEIIAGNFEIPETLSLEIVPVLNPDGLYLATNKEGRFTENDATTVTKGRFNANGIDLNRNFDCKWKPTSSWRGELVSAGTSAFSEPEALALKNLVDEIKPSSVVFWHSQANAVYASECEDGIIPETLTVMNIYARAANYNAIPSFDAYPISGDAEGWLASIGIPAVTVELRTRDNIEWEQNKAGVMALMDYHKLAR